MENFDANAGTNKLANVLSDRMRRENDTSLRQISKYRWHPFLKVMEMLPAQ